VTMGGLMLWVGDGTKVVPTVPTEDALEATTGAAVLRVVGAGLTELTTTGAALEVTLTGVVVGHGVVEAGAAVVVGTGAAELEVTWLAGQTVV
jgi:hypothetical protein